MTERSRWFQPFMTSANMVMSASEDEALTLNKSAFQGFLVDVSRGWEFFLPLPLPSPHPPKNPIYRKCQTSLHRAVGESWSRSVTDSHSSMLFNLEMKLFFDGDGAVGECWAVLAYRKHDWDGFVIWKEKDFYHSQRKCSPESFNANLWDRNQRSRQPCFI